MSSDRSARALRGVVAAAFSTFVALLSHVAGGGTMPGVIGVVVPLMFSMMVCVFLAGRRLSVLRLTLSVAASQLLFHTLFVLGAAQGTTSRSGVSGHAGHGAPVSLDTSSMPIAHDMQAGAGMWIAHVVAGVVTIAALYLGESLLSTIAAFKEFVLARLMPAVFGGHTSPARPLRVSLSNDVFLPRPLSVHLETTALRGPPALSFL